MLRARALVMLLGFAVRCGGNAAPPDGGSPGNGNPGTAGTAGSVGPMCPEGGATGPVGADGLPFCAVTTRPLDPMNVSVGVADAAADAARISTVPNTSNEDDNCNRLDQIFQHDSDGGDAGVKDCFTLSDPLCAPEPFAAGDGGVALDGGAVEAPAGGTLVDGDYQLVRYRSNVASGHGTKRTIGVYAGATYVEWADYEKGGSAFGEDQVLRLNTTMSAAGTTWTVVDLNCGSLVATGYGYTASGTEIDLYDFDASGVLQNVYTYQRTCSR
jgi:hypothetical protein